MIFLGWYVFLSVLAMAGIGLFFALALLSTVRTQDPRPGAIIAFTAGLALAVFPIASFLVARPDLPVDGGIRVFLSSIASAAIGALTVILLRARCESAASDG